MSATQFADLIVHVGHEVEVARYTDGNDEAVNVAVECVECGEVLLDFDRDEED